MTEERKHAILFAATLLSARRLIAIAKAVQVLERIDAKYATTDI